MESDVPKVTQQVSARMETEPRLLESHSSKLSIIAHCLPNYTYTRANFLGEENQALPAKFSFHLNQHKFRVPPMTTTAALLWVYSSVNERKIWTFVHTEFSVKVHLSQRTHLKGATRNKSLSLCQRAHIIITALSLINHVYRQSKSFSLCSIILGGILLFLDILLYINEALQKKNVCLCLG